ncbi:hypothetical protein [Okeania sp. SIO2C9]|uniref:hypothetical protein n=1 Tax=Okeania sp. SIO2C9 TaxID=2607791 RepID=UPI0025D7CD75|nr:hypothetical protein [Okeania sp. SIO2C9]
MKSQLINNKELSSQQKNEMYLLLSTHFVGVKRDVFDEDLAEKNWILLLKDKNSHQLQGFSTLLIYNTEFKGETISVVYSGDTIVDPSAWSSSALSKAWIEAIDLLSQEFALGKLYWLLICSGYRTYRFLPVFWQEFYPRFERETPKEIQDLIDFLAAKKFGKNYDRETGIVRFLHPHQLKEGLKGIPPERLNDPHISFFNNKNPCHINGDELVCLTEISLENLTKAGKRMWKNKKTSLKKNRFFAVAGSRQQATGNKEENL